MSPPVQVWRFQQHVGSREALRRLLSPIEFDWTGARVEAKLRYCLAVDRESLWFHFRSALPPRFDATCKTGEYREGLWKQDVAELFLCEDGSERYQEFNFSPAGAWWSMSFASYRREERQDFRPPTLSHIRTRVDADGWELECRIPRAELAVRIELSQQTRVNVAGIAYTPDARYFTAAPLDSEKPDFHLTAQFPPIAVENVPDSATR